jgi:nitrogen fixation protein FixH
MSRAWNGYHVLTTLVATFAVVLAVNVLFIVKAYTTFSGEDQQKPYLQGIEYNDTLDRRARQARLGWKATIGAIRIGQGSVRIVASLANRSGAPVENVSLGVLLKHPSDAAKDREIRLIQAKAGVYEGAATGVQAGAWDLILIARDAPATPFEAERRIWLP